MNIKQHNFLELVNKINQTNEALRNYAIKAINVSLTVRNWLFGFYIVEYEQNGEDRAKYGENLLENLSKSLSDKGLKNIVPAELSRFRQFYITYPQFLMTLSKKSLNLPEQILGAVSQELQIIDKPTYIEPIKLLNNLSFSHFSELLKIDDSLKRAFYEIECIKGVWSVRELRRQISTLFYERTGISQKPEKLINMMQSNVEKQNFSDIMKSHFTFHKQIFENIYYRYEDNHGAKWNYEMPAMSYELVKHDLVFWISTSFNFSVMDIMSGFYPFESNKVEKLISKILRFRKKNRYLENIYSFSIFMHFAGCQNLMDLSEKK